MIKTSIQQPMWIVKINYLMHICTDRTGTYPLRVQCLSHFHVKVHVYVGVSV